MIEKANHHFLIGGESRSNASGEKTEDSRGITDCWIIELSETGELLGQKTFGGNMVDGLYSLNQNAAGEIIAGCYSLSGISGEKQNFDRGNTDFWVVKLDAESLRLNESQPASAFPFTPIRHMMSCIFQIRGNRLPH